MAETEALEGTVLRVVFSAPDGSFAVLRLDVPARGQPVTVIGPLSEVAPGETLKLEGTWERHPAHGEQFRASRAIVDVPRTPDGVARYLEGLKGIGPELAKRLVAAFSVEAVEVIEKEPWRVAQIKGVGKTRAARFAVFAKERRAEREVMIFLQGLGVSLAYARRIYKTYGDQAIQKVRENPYRLARDVTGIGFFIADRIARGMGIDPASTIRIQAGVLHELAAFSDVGHVFAPRQHLEHQAAEALAVDPARVSAAVDQLTLEGAVILDEGNVYQPWLHRAEMDTAARIRSLLAEPRPPPPGLHDAEKLSVGQRRAIELAGTAAVAVITGGPGTGKTTVVRALVSGWERAKRRVLLAAPTGRAAKRLQEATGRNALTVHRLLEWGRGAREGRRGATPFGRDADHPLEADLLVVDEASMLDLPLARGLVQAVPLGATLVLIGDVDQLPSVGPGQVLGDLIASGVVPVARLTEVFRQEEGSGITENAYRILAGEIPRSEEPEGKEKQDFYVVRAEEPERARDLVVRMCRERIPERFGFDPRRDVQVLAPMHRGQAGTEELNRALQAALNPDGAEVTHAGRALRVGDKVMQLRNDYDRDVFNGDLGIVQTAAMEEGDAVLEVDFDGRRVRYQADDLDALDLAYAVTVHKSQGSEYPAVVLTTLMQHFVLLRRNLLYTAVTRGKRLVVIVGSERALRRAVEQGEVDERHTALRRRLRAAVGAGRV